MILVYTVFTANSRPQVKPIIRSITFRIIVIADSGSVDEVGQYDSKTGDTADRGMAWYQEKIYRSSNDRDSNGQYDCFHKDFCVIQLCVFIKKKNPFHF